MWFVHQRKVFVVVFSLVVVLICAFILNACSTPPANQPTAVPTATATLRPTATPTWLYLERLPSEEELLKDLITLSPKEKVSYLSTNNDYRWERPWTERGAVCIQAVAEEVQMTVVFHNDETSAYVYVGKTNMLCGVKFYTIRHRASASTFVQDSMNLMIHEIRWGAQHVPPYIVYNANIPMPESIKYVDMSNIKDVVGGGLGTWEQKSEQYYYYKGDPMTNGSMISGKLTLPLGSYFWFLDENNERVPLMAYDAAIKAEVYYGHLYVLLPPKQPKLEPTRTPSN